MIICVVGPTAVGKTRLAEVLSKKYDAIVVNCDAMQVYREMNIGTAKYTAIEDLGQPHHLFDIVDPDYVYTVYDYQKDLRKVISDNDGRNIVLVGGTGLYLKAGLYNYEFTERCETCQFEGYSNLQLYELLEERGLPDGIHLNNRRRMIARLNSTGNSKKKDEILYENVYIIGLTTDRHTLYDKIDRRVEAMMEEGLLEEVKRLYEKYGFTKAMKTGIGYKELIAYFKGLLTLKEAVELIKQKSRKYAKRQYTWFEHQMDVRWFQTNYENFDETIDEISRYIEDENKL